MGQVNFELIVDETYSGKSCRATKVINWTIKFLSSQFAFFDTTSRNLSIMPISSLCSFRQFLLCPRSAFLPCTRAEIQSFQWQTTKSVVFSLVALGSLPENSSSSSVEACGRLCAQRRNGRSQNYLGMNSEKLFQLLLDVALFFGSLAVILNIPAHLRL